MREGANSSRNYYICSFDLLAVLKSKMKPPVGLSQLRYFAAIDVRHGLPLIPEPVFAKILHPDPIRKAFTHPSCKIR